MSVTSSDDPIDPSSGPAAEPAPRPLKIVIGCDTFAPDINAGDKVASKYLKWIGLADPEAIKHRAEKRAESGGCEPAK